MLFLQNEQAFEEVFQNANFRSFTFRIRVKLETYNVSKVPGAEGCVGKLLLLTTAALSVSVRELPTGVRPVHACSWNLPALGCCY